MTVKQVVRMTLIVGAVALGAFDGGCGTTESNPMPPSTVNFALRNDGAQTVYLFQACLINYTITSLADPAHTITRLDGCACMCTQASCGECGACAQNAIDVAVGTARNDDWTAISFTTESRPTGSCFRQQALPPGSYRIDVPVYPTADDAVAGTSARTATQSFTLPAQGTVVDVALGVSP